MYRTLPDNGQLPYALYTAAQVKNLDRIAIEQYAMPAAVLMDNAGRAAFAVLLQRWPQAKHIAVFCGAGNNAGDGYVIARLAAEQAMHVTLYQLGDTGRLSDAAAQHRDRLPSGVHVCKTVQPLAPEIDVIVDALLGTGLNSNLKDDWLQAVNTVNAAQAGVLAVDIPSGLNADTGQVMGAAVKAAVTVSFIGLKQGMFTAQARDYCGQILFASLDIPARVYAGEILNARRVDWPKVRQLLAPRSRVSHKGDYGHVLVVGGSPGYSGAARLAAEAALRCGAGLVSVATDIAHAATLNIGRPELMVHAIEQSSDLEKLLQPAGVVVFGPGAGQEFWAQSLLHAVLQTQLPVVIDADGLNLLAADAEYTKLMGKHVLLTPHPGEAARLLQTSVADIEADRFAAIDALRRKYRCHIILKGAGSLILDAQAAKPVAVCSQGNPGMASGGMGDVLAGICGALMAQQHEPAQAALLACCLHAAAADRQATAGETGMLASDLFVNLRELINEAS